MISKSTRALLKRVPVTELAYSSQPSCREGWGLLFFSGVLLGM
jgi:hypothetical protein